jgi:hypothetical protein
MLNKKKEFMVVTVLIDAADRLLNRIDALIEALNGVNGVNAVRSVKVRPNDGAPSERVPFDKSDSAGKENEENASTVATDVHVKVRARKSKRPDEEPKQPDETPKSETEPEDTTNDEEEAPLEENAAPQDDTEEQDNTVYTVEELRATGMEKSRQGKREQLKALLTSFKAENISTLKEEFYGAFMQKLKAL